MKKTITFSKGFIPSVIISCVLTFSLFQALQLHIRDGGESIEELVVFFVGDVQDRIDLERVVFL